MTKRRRAAISFWNRQRSKLTRSSAEHLSAITFALARTAVCAWRAAHQSIVHDEAFSFLYFIDGPWSSLWSFYHAANHVLYSFLAKVSVALFGLSELTLRLPSVMAGFFFMWGVSPRARKLRVAHDPLDRLPCNRIAPTPDGLFNSRPRLWAWNRASGVGPLCVPTRPPNPEWISAGPWNRSQSHHSLPSHRINRRAFPAGQKRPDQGHRCHERGGGWCCHGHLLLSLSHRHPGGLLRRGTFPLGFCVHSGRYLDPGLTADRLVRNRKIRALHRDLDRAGNRALLDRDLGARMAKGRRFREVKGPFDLGADGVFPAGSAFSVQGEISYLAHRAVSSDRWPGSLGPQRRISSEIAPFAR